MGTHPIAVVGGDGIGPEVAEAGCRVGRRHHRGRRQH